MKILGIETSCDETAAAVVENGTKILSNVVASSLPLHAKTGGIIPEVAAREQAKVIIPVIDSALKEAKNSPQKIEVIAVTFGPGLVGSLLVGVEVTKTLSYVWQKPIVPVNHLIGHLYSAWLDNSKPPEFPLVSLIVSGGHTELLLVEGHGRWKHLGGTRDDAAGEALDKTARVLGLDYPGGPEIQKAAVNGDPKKFSLPRPLIVSPTYDFSFSGLKTALVNLVDELKQDGSKKLHTKQTADLAASIQEAIVDVLVSKTIKTAEKFRVKNIVVGGGVAANERLRQKLGIGFSGKIYFSTPKLSTDNGAVIASAAFFNYKPLDWSKIKTDPGILI